MYNNKTFVGKYRFLLDKNPPTGEWISIKWPKNVPVKLAILFFLNRIKCYKMVKRLKSISRK